MSDRAKSLNTRLIQLSLPGYSALDFSLVDPHWGTVGDWQNVVDEIHAHGMYIMLDFTVGTMGDLIGWKQ